MEAYTLFHYYLPVGLEKQDHLAEFFYAAFISAYGDVLHDLKREPSHVLSFS
jgi:hypothetical protein